MEKKNGKDVVSSAQKVAEKAGQAADFVAEKAIDAASLSKKAISDGKALVVKQLDFNGDGQIGIDDIISLAIKVPGVHISRDSFLQKEFFKNHPQDIIDKAIATTPAQAGISAEEIDRIADEVIKYERNCVSGISVALGAPGGWAMAATIPADIIQYYGYTLRATQKLLYLYGFPEIDADGEGIQLDTQTINTLIICLGVMNGVAGANNAIKAMAKALAVGVEKQLMKKALTKGAIYPLVKNVMKWFGVNLTKSIFAGAVKKAIPVVGGIIGGGITFATFKPCCLRLKHALEDTMLSNPNHVTSEAEEKITDDILGSAVDTDFEDISES